MDNSKVSLGQKNIFNRCIIQIQNFNFSGKPFEQAKAELFRLKEELGEVIKAIEQEHIEQIEKEAAKVLESKLNEAHQQYGKPMHKGRLIIYKDFDFFRRLHSCQYVSPYLSNLSDFFSTVELSINCDYVRGEVSVENVALNDLKYSSILDALNKASSRLHSYYWHIEENAKEVIFSSSCTYSPREGNITTTSKVDKKQNTFSLKFNCKDVSTRDLRISINCFLQELKNVSKKDEYLLINL